MTILIIHLQSRTSANSISMWLVAGLLMLLTAPPVSIIHVVGMIWPVTMTGPELTLKFCLPESVNTCQIQDKKIKHAVLLELPRSLLFPKSWLIQTPTLHQNVRRAQQFVKFCGEASLPRTNAVGLDQVRVTHLDHSFRENLEHSGANHLLTAPTLLRLPLPSDVLGHILGPWLVLPFPDMVTLTFVAFILHLGPRGSIPPVLLLARPTLSSRIGVLLFNLLQEGLPGLINNFEETVLVDNSWLMRSHFQEPSKATLCSQQHVGASVDVGQGQHSLAEINRRRRGFSLKRFV